MYPVRILQLPCTSSGYILTCMLSTGEVLHKLRSLREAKDLKQEHVAKRLGIDRTTYIRKEKGHIPITTTEWLRIADVMKTNADYFFQGKARQNKSQGSGKGCVDKNEELLLRIYNGLSAEEKKDFVASIRILLKGINRKKVQEALRLLL